MERKKAQMEAEKGETVKNMFSQKKRSESSSFFYIFSYL